MSKFSDYRKRRKEYVIELENKIKELKLEVNRLYAENAELKSTVYYLENRTKPRTPT